MNRLETDVHLNCLSPLLPRTLMKTNQILAFYSGLSLLLSNGLPIRDYWARCAKTHSSFDAEDLNSNRIDLKWKRLLLKQKTLFMCLWSHWLFRTA